MGCDADAGEGEVVGVLPGDLGLERGNELGGGRMGK